MYSIKQRENQRMKTIEKFIVFISIMIIVCGSFLIFWEQTHRIKAPDYHTLTHILQTDSEINHINIPKNTTVEYLVILSEHEKNKPLPLNNHNDHLSWLVFPEQIKWGNFKIKSIGYGYNHNHLAWELHQPARNKHNFAIMATAGQVPYYDWLICELENNLLFFSPKNTQHRDNEQTPQTGYDWRAEHNEFSGCLNAKNVKFVIGEQKLELNNIGVMKVKSVDEMVAHILPQLAQQDIWLLYYPPSDGKKFEIGRIILDEKQRFIHASGTVKDDKEGFRIRDCVYKSSNTFRVDFVDNQNVIWTWDGHSIKDECKSMVQPSEQWVDVLKQYEQIRSKQGLKK